MAGFFRQVAQRALQPTTQLHSAAALPYAATRDAGGDDGSAGLEWSAPAAETKPAGIAAADPLPKILALRREPLATREAATATRTSSRPATGNKKTRSVRSPSRKPRASAKPAKRIEPIPRSSTEPGRPIAVKGDLSPVAAFKPETAQVDAARQARPAHRRPTRAQVRAAPRSRPASPSKKSAASGATHDVHIHIGRVELAAISAPAPAKRAASSDKRPMSLNEYLQHRRSPNTGSS